jgi:hypothetical protein
MSTLNDLLTERQNLRDEVRMLRGALRKIVGEVSALLPVPVDDED